MAVTQTALHMLTHTARILLMAEQRPEHNGKKNHDRRINIYRGQWDQLSDQDKEELQAAALEIADMTPEIVSAAVLELEN